MNLDNLNKKYVLIFIVVILVSYFIFANFYKSHQINQDVIKNIEKIDSIKSYEINKNDHLTLIVQFKNNISLFSNYQKLLNIKENFNENMEILIKNENLSDFEKIYYDIHHYLYEALERKNYTKIKNEVDNYMKNNNLKYSLYFDNKNIYLQFNYQNKSYYKILRGV